MVAVVTMAAAVLLCNQKSSTSITAVTAALAKGFLISSTPPLLLLLLPLRSLAEGLLLSHGMECCWKKKRRNLFSGPSCAHTLGAGGGGSRQEAINV